MNEQRKPTAREIAFVSVIILPAVPAFWQWLPEQPIAFLDFNAWHALGTWISVVLTAGTLVFRKHVRQWVLDEAFAVFAMLYGFVVCSVVVEGVIEGGANLIHLVPWAGAAVLTIAVFVGFIRSYRIFPVVCVLFLVFMPFLHREYIEIAPDSMRSHWHGLQYHSVGGKEVPIIESDGVQTHGVGLFQVPESLTETYTLLPEDIAFRITFPNLPVYFLFALLGLYALWLRPRWYSKE